MVPIGFVWTGAEFVISTATTAPKVAALGHLAGHRRGPCRFGITPRWVRLYDVGAGRMPRLLPGLAERKES